MVLAPSLGGSPSRVSLQAGQGWFLCFSPSPVAPHSWQPVWSSCKGAPSICSQPYTSHLSSLPEEAKKVLGQWSNSHSKVMRSRGPTTRPSPPPHRRSNPVPSCANLYISMCCSLGIPSTLLHRVHIPPCQTGCPLGKGCGKDGTGHLCGSSPASQHRAVLSFSPGREVWSRRSQGGGWIWGACSSQGRWPGSEEKAG